MQHPYFTIYSNIMNEQRKGVQRQKLQEYLLKLTNQQSLYQTMISDMQKEFIAQSEHLIKDRLSKFSQQFIKLRKNTDVQLNSLKYYNANPEQKGNLYSLFTLIDQKIDFNCSIIRSTSFQITLPHPSPNFLQEDSLYQKVQIYEKYVKQLMEIVRSENVRKYCKKEIENGEKVASMYEKLIQGTKQRMYCTDLKLKRTLEEGISQLSQYRHVESLSLALTTQKGKMAPDHYHSLINALLPNRFFLTHLELKLMDMEFSQEKCDILRKRLGEYKRLKKVTIVNYYKECKLGMFEDFNWHPYRKKVNINSGTW